MKRLLIGLILLAMLFMGIPLNMGFTPQQKYYTIDNFSDGSTYKVVGLDGVDYNDSAKISIPNNCTIENAAFTISTKYNQSGEYPENLQLDIGSDGNIEYAFKGAGYGGFGKQFRLFDGRTYVDVPSTSGGTLPTYYLKIPTDAVVTNATFKLFPSPTNQVLYLSWDNSWTSDSGVDSYSPSSNYGSSAYLTRGQYQNTHTEYAYMKFDMDHVNDNLPSGANINTVQVGWYRVHIPYYYYWHQYWGAYRVTSSWSESTITWNNKPSDVGYYESSKDLYGGWPYYGNLYNRYWTITNMYNYWKDHPSENYGLMLKRYSPSSYWYRYARNPQFYSSEYYSSSYRPRLRIYYSIMPYTPKVDVGSDGSIDWKYNGTITGETNVTGLATSINQYLKTHFFDEVDDYGNRITYVPISVGAENTCLMRLQDIDIRYNYTHPILYNPYKGTLLKSLREVIPQSESGSTDIEVNLTSTNKLGFVNLTSLHIEGYLPNYTPTLLSDIPDQIIDEGNDNSKLVDLAQYFNDDLTDPLQMTYGVVSYTNSTYVKLSINDGHYLGVTTKDKDWYGSVEVKVFALDSGGKVILSNKFTITVNSVNDPPRIKTPLPDIHIKEEGSASFFIMKTGQPYFYDVEGDPIYINYTLSSNPLGLGFSMKEDYEKYIFEFKPETNFNTKESGPITVTLTVADRSDMSSNIDVTFKIIVDSIDDPPEISVIPDVSMVEDSSTPGSLDIAHYVYDPDTAFDDLNISIISAEPKINVELEGRTAYFYPEPNYNGIATFTLMVKDTINTVTQDFRVRVSSVNDIPEVFVDNLKEGQVIDTLYLIEGKAFDVDGYIQDVEVKVGDNEWEVATGTFIWNFFLDIRDYSTGDTTIHVRAYDGIAYSPEAIYNVTISNRYAEEKKNMPPTVNVTTDLSGELSGVVTLSGTASDDSDYIQKVEIKVDKDGVWRPAFGTKSWTFELNTRQYPSYPYGNHILYIRAFDGKLYGEPLKIKITIHNIDSDGDGIPDSEELKLHLNPFNPNDAAFDNDGDGFTNYQEYVAKTDIYNGNNHPLIETKEKKEPTIFWTMLFSVFIMMLLVIIAYAAILKLERQRVRWLEGIENLRVKSKKPTFLQKMVKMKEAILPALFATSATAPALPGREEEASRSALPPSMEGGEQIPPQ